MTRTIITGTGSYIPEIEVDGLHFATIPLHEENGTLIDKPFTDILKKFVDITAIEKRRYAPEGISNSEMGKIAAEKAILNCAIDKETIDYILYATNYGEVNSLGYADFMPPASARLKHKLKIQNRKCRTYDVIFGCPGFVESLILADDLIQAGKANTILVVGSDLSSRIVDPHDRNKLIFSDGAGAMIVQSKPEAKGGIVHANTLCDNGDELDLMWNGPSFNKDFGQDRLYIKMNGRKVYEYALKNVPVAIKSTLDEAGVSLIDIKKILIHQANAKMDEAMIDRLFKLYGLEKTDPELVPMTVQYLGNTSIATVPTLFDLINRGLLENHSFKSQDYIVMASVGAGMNINCILYQVI